MSTRRTRSSCNSKNRIKQQECLDLSGSEKVRWQGTEKTEKLEKREKIEKMGSGAELLSPSYPDIEAN